jgi:hypothetical protein
MKKEHEIFIAQMKEHGDKIIAYRAAYPNCISAGGASSGALRLMRQPHINERLKDIAPVKKKIKPEMYLTEKDVFTREFALSNNIKEAFKIAFPGRPFTKSAARMIHTSSYIQGKLKELKAEADKLVIAELKQQREFLFLTYAEKRDLLRRIALGEETIKKRVWENDRWIMKDVPADMDDRLRAIDIENRMTGDYSPDKLQVEQYINGFIIKITGDGWEEAA